MLFWVLIWIETPSLSLLSPSSKPFLVDGSGARVLARYDTDGILFEDGTNASAHNGSVNSRADKDLVIIMVDLNSFER